MDDTIKLTFVGDIMCKADMLQPYRQGESYDFSDLFRYCPEILKGSDFACANLETPISLDNTDLSSAQYCFNSPFEFAESVKKAGFDFVATANNHCLDRGIAGISSTIDSLDRVGLLHTGIFKANDKTPLIEDIQGVKCGFLSYTYGTNAFSNHNYLSLSDLWRVNLFQMQELWNPITRFLTFHKSMLVSRIYHRITQWFNTYNHNKQPYERKEFSFFQRIHLKRELRRMRKLADIIVVYMHAGGQYNPEVTSHTKQICGFLRKNGANIIVGSHEHVVHGSSNTFLNQNSVETYSLGNFDGIAGVYAEPMDKMAEYSIAWHVYICKDSQRISKTSFTILKTIPVGNNGAIQTVPVTVLLQSENDSAKRQKLWNDMQTIAHRFANININIVQEEYLY